MTRFHNRTRRSSSIPRRLLREGRPWLIPLYHVLRTSDLAREGIEHSGSYRFAEHIYAGQASGRYGIGWLLDAVLLRLPAARALRARLPFALEEIRAVVREHAAAAPVDLLAVPCGLAREFFVLADEWGGREHAPPVFFHGIDLDADLIAGLQTRAAAMGSPFSFRVGDALAPEAYGRPYDAVVSSGLVEFLPDEDAVRFFSLIRAHLKPGGRLLTSNLDRHPPADYLLRTLAELHTHYRDEPHLRALVAAAGFDDIRTRRVAGGLQTLLVARDSGASFSEPSGEPT